jgi:enamine deaminase RidA (YjgF/YER057c/UK114 family)
MAGSPLDRRTVVGVSRPVSIIHTKHHPSMTTRKAIFPENPHALYREHGYSPAIQSGDLLFVSGMVGAREDGAPEPDLQAQIRLAFENLHGVLEAAACNTDDVVDVTLYMTDPESSVGFALEELKKFFREPAPNITAVGVNWLAGFQFEIKVTARIPQR